MQVGCVAVQTARGSAGLLFTHWCLVSSFSDQVLGDAWAPYLSWLCLHGGTQQDSVFLLAMCEAS